VRANPIIRIFGIVMITYVIVSAAILAGDAADDGKPQRQTSTSGQSDASFDLMMQVLTHQRCINCHPSDGIPKQGDDRHPHYFGIARGKDSHGFQATKCNTCHQAENNAFSGVPGAPEWALAPHSMRWEGLSRTEIAKSILDPKRNGDKNKQQIMHHLTEHELVLWAWDPGVDANGRPRQPPPVPKDQYITAVKKWFEDGAVIPNE
jgi:cytochrome c553